MEPSTLAFASLVVALHAIEFAWVWYQVNRRGPAAAETRTRRLMADPEVVRSLGDNLASRIPGGMKGGHDPTALAYLRVEKERERMERAAKAKADVLAYATEKLGSAQAFVALRFLEQAGVLNEKVLGVVSDWHPLVEPYLRAGAAHAQSKLKVDANPYMEA